LKEIWPKAANLGIKKAFLHTLFNRESFEAEDVCHKDHRMEGTFLIKVFGLPDGGWLWLSKTSPPGKND
jgi:hypothetical protein